jgi:hypothetical protein
MRTQEQALRVYYAAMPDGELRDAAANRGSFLPVVQKLLAEELQRRHLAAAPLGLPSLPALPAEGHGVLGVLRHAFRH